MCISLFLAENPGAVIVSHNRCDHTATNTRLGSGWRYGDARRRSRPFDPIGMPVGHWRPGDDEREEAAHKRARMWAHAAEHGKEDSGSSSEESWCLPSEAGRQDGEARLRQLLTDFRKDHQDWSGSGIFKTTLSIMLEERHGGGESPCVPHGHHDHVDRQPAQLGRGHDLHHPQPHSHAVRNSRQYRGHLVPRPAARRIPA